MRIAMLSTFYPYRGGIAQFNARLFRELEKTEEVIPFTFSRQYPSVLFPGKTQYVTTTDKADKIKALRVLDSVNPVSFLNTVKAIRREKPEVLFLRFWHPFFAPSLGVVARLLRKEMKVVSLLDNVIPHEDKWFYRPFIKFFLKQSHGFIVMSNTVKNDLHRFLPNAKVFLKQHPLYNHLGDKIERSLALEKYGLDNRKKTLLFFGFIREYKGLDILLKAFAMLDDSYQLIIAGESYTDFSPYDKLIKECPNNNILLLQRYIADDEVARLFSCADVCVQPYRSATQSGITAVSYHFDIPMIVTNVGGLKEDVIDGVTGIIVNEINPEAVAVAVRKFFSTARENDFKEGIARLKKELSWEAFAQKFKEFVSHL